MTQQLTAAIERAKNLPIQDQNAIADLIMNELDSESRWDELFAKSPDLLSRMAAEALAEHSAGKTIPLDPDSL